MGKYRFLLFVSGDDHLATNATATVREICDEHVPGSYELEVIDVNALPEMAEQHGVVATPTLIRSEPDPPVRLIGEISKTDQVLRILGLGAA